MTMYLFVLIFGMINNVGCVINTLAALDDEVAAIIEVYFEKQSTIPIQTVNGIMNVNVGMDLISVVDVDSDSGLVSVNGLFTVTWTEQRYTVVTDDLWTLIQGSSIWIPPLRIANSAGSSSFIASMSDTVKFHLSTGAVVWKPPFQTSVLCSNAKFFPFDEFDCTIRVESTDYDITELELISTSGTISTVYFEESSEWQLTSTSTVTGSSNNVAYIDFKFTIKRGSAFYACFIIVTVAVVSFLHTCVFLLNEMDSRITFSTQCFLCSVVTTLVIMSQVPKSSLPLSLVVIYLLTELFINAVITVFVVCTHWLHITFDVCYNVLVSEKNSVAISELDGFSEGTQHGQNEQDVRSAWPDNGQAEETGKPETTKLKRDRNERKTIKETQRGKQKGLVFDAILFVSFLVLHAIVTVSFFVPIGLNLGD